MYVKELETNTTDSMQTSPAYCLTFVRWDTHHTFQSPPSNPVETRTPLVVYNDAISVQVSYNKSSMFPSMQATLVSGDINYSTAIHTGDYVFVNMVNWYDKAEEIRIKVSEGKPINGLKDGFKGVFKIQSVTRTLSVSQEGVKSYLYAITGSMFTEFNSVMLYNPVIEASLKNRAEAFYSTLIGETFKDKAVKAFDLSEILETLYASLLGMSHRSRPGNIKDFGVTHYKVPKDVASLLGMSGKKYVNELYNMITGVWGSSGRSTSMSSGFNPSFSLSSPAKSNIYKTPTPLQGKAQLLPQDWNQKTVLSIFHNYLNSAMNELYTAFRVDPKKDRVMPTIIARQKPFNTNKFKPTGKETPFTKFLELPRWKLSPELVLGMSLSKSEATRTNFVQVYTRNLAHLAAENHAEQIASGNIIFDDTDIQRHGLKPYIITVPFDFIQGTDQVPEIGNNYSKEWTALVADWVLEAHLKESGTFQCVGIEDPIAVGDNLEFDGVVYHIENINHSFQVNKNGVKMFRTTISVSYGIDTRSNNTEQIYPEMEHTDRFTKGKEDFRNNKLLPGFSDTQDILGRTNGEEKKETQQKFFQNPRPKR